jgi:hypothetical protein
MPKHTFALEKGLLRRIRVTWKGTWKDVTVRFDDKILGVIPNQKALETGKEFPLPDGTSIKVQLARQYGSTELQVLRNGQLLPGSVPDPSSRVKTAYNLFYLIAVINIPLGILSVLGIEFIKKLGFGPFSLIFGLVFLLLAIFTQRLANTALVLGIAFYALDGLVALFLGLIAGNLIILYGMVFRVIVMIAMFQALPAMRELIRRQAST